MAKSKLQVKGTERRAEIRVQKIEVQGFSDSDSRLHLRLSCNLITFLLVIEFRFARISVIVAKRVRMKNYRMNLH